MRRPYPIIAALSALGILSAILIFPYLQTLVLSAIIAYIMYPLYRKMDAYVPRYAAIILCSILVLILSAPLILLMQSLIQESYSVINILQQVVSQNQSVECNSLVCTKIQILLQDLNINSYIQSMLDNLSKILIEQTSVFIGNLPSMLLQTFIFFFAFYYALKDGNKLVGFIDKASKQIQSTFTVHLKHMDNVMRAILFGYFSVAFLQGVVALIGYAVLGVPNAFFWATLTAIFALIPIIGTAIIWFPLAAMQVVQGLGENEFGTIARGVILAAYGLFIISTIDNFIRPGIIAARVNVHPLTILIGILGGLQFLGAAGFIIGPVVLSTTIRMVQDTVNQ